MCETEELLGFKKDHKIIVISSLYLNIFQIYKYNSFTNFFTMLKKTSL